MVFLIEIVTIVRKNMIIAWNEEEKLPIHFKLSKTSDLFVIRRAISGTVEKVMNFV